MLFLLVKCFIAQRYRNIFVAFRFLKIFFRLRDKEKRHNFRNLLRSWSITRWTYSKKDRYEKRDGDNRSRKINWYLLVFLNVARFRSTALRLFHSIILFVLGTPSWSGIPSLTVRSLESLSSITLSEAWCTINLRPVFTCLTPERLYHY